MPFTTIGNKTSLAGEGNVNANSIGPFGSLLTADPHPTAQAAFIYSVNPVQWTTSSCGAGAYVTASLGVMTSSSGTSISGSASVRLSRSLKYRPGQGSMCRLTALFDDGAPDTLQLAGIGNEESGYYFAQRNNDFGILHREKSKREIRSFSITTPPAGAATITVTLGNSVKSVAINGGGSNNQTSYQLSQADYSQVGSGWSAESIDGTIYFISKIPGPVGGTFSLFNGATEIATKAVVQTGELPTETFISQSQWNIDTMDGNGESRFTLDRSYGNVYGIGYQYLGFGNAFFSVENPETGLLSACHMIKNANRRTTTNVRNPQMTARWSVINSGSLAAPVSIKGASAGVFTEGMIIRNIGPAFASGSVRSGIASQLTTNIVPVMSIRANSIFLGQCNYGEIDLFNLSIGTDTGNATSTILTEVFIYKNAVLGGPVNFQHVDSNKSIAAVDLASTSISVGPKTQLLKNFIVGANEAIILTVQNENFFLTSGETLTLAARTNKNTSDATFSMSWFEDQ
jgi:hypothetical protein